MTEDEARGRLRARRESIEHGAVLNNELLLERLRRASAEGREQALRVLLPATLFDEWRVLVLAGA